MKSLFFYIFTISAFAILLVACKQEDMNKGIAKQIKQKYQELNNSAEYVTVNGVPVTQKTRFIKPDDGVVPEGMQLKQIALVRHGEPDLKKNRAV